MTLNSLYCLGCFAIIFSILALFQLGRRVKRIEKGIAFTQVLLLLGSSYFFIAKTYWGFCLPVLAVTLISYTAGVGIELSRRCIGECSLHSVRSDRVIAYVGGIALVGILVYFKYVNFFIDSINRVFGGSISTLRIILPLGISFYVFSALSYIIDVYHNRYKAEKNAICYALYVAFFPKFVAGPIVRADEFLAQVKNYRGIERQAVIDGIQIFVFGLFKKIVLADHLGVFVDDVFYSPSAYNTGTVLLAVLSYSFQIYLDFSGYSDMAIGIAKTIGFDFKPNFNLPYIATDISDFWKRWHISLSSWLRDYVYIPLGGSQRGERRTLINLLLTMFISGLWHGAGWTFALWGILHGVVSCANRIIKNKTVVARSKTSNIISSILTFIIVTMLWVVFRASSLRNAWDMIKGMFTVHGGINQPFTWSVFTFVILIIVIIISCKKNNGEGFYPLLDLHKFGYQVVFFVFCGLTIIMGYFGNTAFIYGKF